MGLGPPPVSTKVMGSPGRKMSWRTSLASSMISLLDIGVGILARHQAAVGRGVGKRQYVEEVLVHTFTCSCGAAHAHVEGEGEILSSEVRDPHQRTSELETGLSPA